jgi:hypothetical protein
VPSPRSSSRPARRISDGASLKVGATLARALRLWWRELRTFAALALAVVAPLTIGVELLIRVTGPIGLQVGVAVAVLTMSVLGEVFCAGLAEHAIRRDQLGLPARPLPELAREVPFLRLAAVSVIVSAVVLFGLVLLILPGLLLFAWLVLATPLVSLEHASVWSALRGSVRLVRGHYWSVLALTTVTFVPAIAGDLVSGAIEHAHAPLWTDLVVEIVTDGLAVSVTAAIVVTMFDTLGRISASPLASVHWDRP